MINSKMSKSRVIHMNCTLVMILFTYDLHNWLNVLEYATKDIILKSEVKECFWSAWWISKFDLLTHQIFWTMAGNINVIQWFHSGLSVLRTYWIRVLKQKKKMRMSKIITATCQIKKQKSNLIQSFKCLNCNFF